MNLSLMSSASASITFTDEKGKPFMIGNDEINSLDKISPILFDAIVAAPEIQSKHFCFNCKFWNVTKFRINKDGEKIAIEGQCRVVHPDPIFPTLSSLQWCGEWQEIPIDASTLPNGDTSVPIASEAKIDSTVVPAP